MLLQTLFYVELFIPLHYEVISLKCIYSLVEVHLLFSGCPS